MAKSAAQKAARKLRKKQLKFKTGKMGPKAKFVPMKAKKKNKKSRPVGPNSMRMVGI